MSDAPERIWAVYYEDISAQTSEVYAQDNNEGFVKKPTEYVRSDLCTIKSQSSPDGWQSIEKAPKDGSWIIAIRPTCKFGKWDRVVIVCWCDEFNKWIWPDSQFDVYADDINEKDDEGYYKYDPYQSDEFTHWMPLPMPPSEKEEK